MTKFSTKLFIAIGILFSASLCSCQEEGCTDESALNYSVVAKKDNGSCVYCQVISSTENTRQQFLKDDNYYDQAGNSNPYYYDEILSFDFKQKTSNYNSSKCASEQCTFDAVVTNRTSKKVTATVQLQFVGSPVTKTIVVNANSTTTLTNVFSGSTSQNLCDFNIENSSVWMDLIGYVNYQ